MLIHLNTIFKKLGMEDSQVLRALITVLIFLIVVGGDAIGQSLPPFHGFPPVEGDLAKRHMSPLGKPCLTFEGFAKPELANKNIYQHLIKATNGCGQNIKVKACYYKTENCVLMSVPPWESKTSILAIFPALKRFQFEVKEQF
jgi:hypothetical protein